MNLNHKVTEGNEVVEVQAKQPGKIKQFIDKHEITPKKVLKTAGKVAAVTGAVVGGFILGRVTGKSDDEDQSDGEFEYYEVPSDEDSAES